MPSSGFSYLYTPQPPSHSGTGGVLRQVRGFHQLGPSLRCLPTPSRIPSPLPHPLFAPPAQVMKEFSVKSLVFSSSATVYGVPEYLPIDENHSVGACTNPYGRTKYFIEKLLEDICMSDTVTWLSSVTVCNCSKVE